MKNAYVHARHLARKSDWESGTDGDSLMLKVLLAMESLKHHWTLEGDKALRSGLALLPPPGILIKHEGEEISAAVLSADGTYLATSGHDKVIKIWDVKSWKEVNRLNDVGYIYEIAFSPDSKYLATTGTKGVKLWNRISGDHMRDFVYSRLPTRFLGFLRNGKYLASLDHVWDVKTGQEIAFLDHKESISGFAFSSDGRFLAAGIREYNSVRIWETMTGRQIDSIWVGGYPDFIRFGSEDQYLAIVTHDVNLNMFKMNINKKRASQDKHQLIRVITHDPEKEEIYTLEGRINDVAFSPDGKYIATASADGTARLWEISSGREITRINHDTGFERHMVVKFVIFSPDGRHLATSGWNTVRIFDIPSYQENVRYYLPSKRNTIDYIEKLIFSPDGSFLAIKTREYMQVHPVTISIHVEVLRNDNTYESVLSPQIGRGYYNVIFSPDEKHLLLAMHARVDIKRISHKREASNASVIPDVRYRVTIRGATASLWGISSDESLFQMFHRKQIRTVIFSDDRKCMATTNTDNVTDFWEIPLRDINYVVHPSEIKALSFPSEGQYHATLNIDNITRLWFCWPENLMAEVCSRLTRNLTLEEWRRYMDDEPYHKTCPKFPNPEK